MNDGFRWIFLIFALVVGAMLLPGVTKLFGKWALILLVLVFVCTVPGWIISKLRK